MTTGADLLRAYLLTQADAMDRAGRAVDDGDPEGVHDLRVACRRARSTLQAHRRLIRTPGRPAAEDLVDDLRRLGLDLSERRDDEVARDLVRQWATADEWPPESTRAVLDALGDATASVGAGSMAGVRGHGQATALRTWTEQAPWRSRTAREAPEALAPAAARAWARLERRHAVASAADDGAVDHGAAWHEVRKATKRVRYVAEVVRGVDDGADAVVGAGKHLQTLLGDRRDAEAVLARLRQAPRSAPVLLGTERARRAMAEAGADVPGAYRALARAHASRA